MERRSIYFDKLNEAITKVCEFIIVLVFMVMGSAILIQIILRTLGQSMIAMEDIALFGFFWLVFLGAAVAFKEGIHVKVEFFVNWMPARVRGLIIMAANFIVLIFIDFVIKKLAPGKVDSVFSRNFFHYSRRIEQPIPVVFPKIVIIDKIF